MAICFSVVVYTELLIEVVPLSSLEILTKPQ